MSGLHVWFWSGEAGHYADVLHVLQLLSLVTALQDTAHLVV